MSLQVIELSCDRAERILFSQLSFSLAPGEMLLINGPNGAGKSSLLRILAGLLIPTEGEVRWNGQSIVCLGDDYHSDIAYLGHKPAVKSGLTVLENLKTASIIANTNNYDFTDLLMQFDLFVCRHLLAQQLSAGQRQRLALIRVLSSAAKLWILDEPLTSLDSSAIEKLHQMMINHLKNSGMVVVASHQQLLFDKFKRIDLSNGVNNDEKF